MAVAPQFSPFEVLDLRMLRAAALEPLFQEEQEEWGAELHWNYRPSVDLIRKHVEAQSLPGYAALSQGRVAGYCFFVYENYKGMIGDLYVPGKYRGERPDGRTPGVASTLLEHALETLEQTPIVRRIEAQLIPFGTEPLAPVFQAHHFCCFPRLFLYKSLTAAEAPPVEGCREKAAGSSPGVELQAWEDRYFEALAELMVDAYSGHVDSQINNQYSNRSGALRFLKNIVIFPGCGVFQHDCSLVALAASGGKRLRASSLVGAVMTSQVAPGVGHITQICVRHGWQGRGLGRRLLEAALERLRAKGYRAVSLTVTAANEGAVGLYRRFGFAVLKEFAAYARNLR